MTASNNNIAAPVSLDSVDLAEIYRRARQHRAEAFASVGAGLGKALRHDIPAAFRRWRAERRTARALAVLDPRMLDDIGLSRADIDDVAARASGRLPALRRMPSPALPQGSGVIDFLVSVEKVLARSIFAHERAGTPANSEQPKRAA